MTASIGLVRALVGELGARGVTTPERLLHELGMDADTLRDGQNRVPIKLLSRLVTRALVLSDEPALGLLLGARSLHLAAPVLTTLASSCATLRESLAALVRYTGLLVSGVSWVVREEPGRVSVALDLSSHIDCPATRRFVAEFLAGAVTHVLGDGPSLISAVGFRHAPALQHRVYRAHFGVAPGWSSRHVQLSLRPSLLDAAHVHADVVLHESMRVLAEQLLPAEHMRASDRVRQLLRYRADFIGVDVAHIASALGCTARALRHRVYSEGYNVRALIDEARFRAAREQLQLHGTAIKALATRLGFAEPSAFHRAFRRWAGQTPTQFIRAAMVSSATESSRTRRALGTPAAQSGYARRSTASAQSSGGMRDGTRAWSRSRAGLPPP